MKDQNGLKTDVYGDDTTQNNAYIQVKDVGKLNLYTNGQNIRGALYVDNAETVNIAAAKGTALHKDIYFNALGTASKPIGTLTFMEWLKTPSNKTADKKTYYDNVRTGDIYLDNEGLRNSKQGMGDQKSQIVADTIELRRPVTIYKSQNSGATDDSNAQTPAIVFNSLKISITDAPGQYDTGANYVITGGSCVPDATRSQYLITGGGNDYELQDGEVFAESRNMATQTGRARLDATWFKLEGQETKRADGYYYAFTGAKDGTQVVVTRTQNNGFIEVSPAVGGESWYLTYKAALEAIRDHGTGAEYTITNHIESVFGYKDVKIMKEIPAAKASKLTFVSGERQDSDGLAGNRYRIRLEITKDANVYHVEDMQSLEEMKTALGEGGNTNEI